MQLGSFVGVVTAIQRPAYLPLKATSSEILETSLRLKLRLTSFCTAVGSRINIGSMQSRVLCQRCIGEKGSDSVLSTRSCDLMIRSLLKQTKYINSEQEKYNG